MRRRDFISVLGCTVTLWPRLARTEQSALPKVGFLSSLSAPVTNKRIDSFSRGLNESGYVVGRDVAVELRLAEGRYERLPQLAVELIGRRVKLIATLASPAAAAAKVATASIPIVFVGAYDPVKAGLVASLNRPGGNVTGVTFIATTLAAKRLELLRELNPRAALIAVLTNPNSPAPLQELSDIRAAARSLDQRLLILPATNPREIDEAFAAFVEQRAGALLVSSDAFLSERSEQMAALAARYALPTLYYNDEAVISGGLISYGASISEAWRLAGVYAGRILGGEAPNTMPVQQSAKVQLTINLKTARSLGLSVPNSILVRADDVVE